MSDYYKITNKNEYHHNYQYKDGLNIDPNPFTGDNGLYFTKLKHINIYLNLGVYIRRVRLPETDPNFKMLKIYDGKIYKANMIILEERMSLLDVTTYKILGLNIYQNMVNVVNIASKEGNIQFLKQIQQERLIFKCNEWAVNLSSTYGHTDILDLLKEMAINTHSKLKYNEWAINNACLYGNIISLNWWINSGLKIIYDEWAIINASISGNIEILDWWVNANEKFALEFKYNVLAVTNASKFGKIQVLDWWKKMSDKGCIKIKYDESAIYEACSNGQIDSLNWWINSDLELKYDSSAFNIACCNGNIDVLNWWIKSDLKILFDKSCIIECCKNGHIDILIWLDKNMGRTVVKQSLENMSLVCKNAHVKKLVKKYLTDDSS